MIQNIYITLLVLGVLLMVNALFQYYSTKNLLANGVIANAEVISLQSDGLLLQYSSSPLLKFTIPNDKEYTFSPEVSTNVQMYHIGDLVKIIYMSNKPQKAKIVSYWGLYRWTLLSLCFGLVFLTIGLGYFYYLTQIMH
jgi:hypothetical protein